MKKNLLKTLFVVTTFALVFIPFMRVSAQTVDVNDEAGLISALENGGNIKLTGNITITKPLYVKVPTVLDGNGFTIDGQIEEKNITPEDGANRSIFTVTAQSGVIFKNITIKNSAKYGIQAYNGGSFTVDNVTIENCNYGAILINGGTVTINDLIMKSNNAGIEFGKGVNVQENPSLVMDGTIRTEQQENTIHVDDAQITQMNVSNTETSEHKITLNNNALSVVDKNGQEIARSNTMSDNIEVVVNGAPEITDPTEEQPTVEEPVEKEEPNPKTADNITLYLIVATAGLFSLGYFGKKVVKG